MKLLKKDRINEVTLRFLSRSANESFARAAAAAFIAQLDPTVEQVYDINPQSRSSASICSSSSPTECRPLWSRCSSSSEATSLT